MMGRQADADLPQSVDPAPDFADRFGRYLLEAGVIDAFALQRARQAEARTGERFDIVLTRLGLLAESEMAGALGRFLGLPRLGP